MKLSLLFLLCLVATAGHLAADQKSSVPDPYAWTVRVYRFPSDELASGFVSRELGQLHAPLMPEANAGADENIKFLKSSNDVVTQYLLVHGIPLPKGSLAAADTASDMLVVRTMNSTHDLIESLAHSFINRVLHYLSLNTHIVEANAEVIVQMVKEAHLQADHRALWEKIEALAGQGKARHVSTMHIDTRSGQGARVSRMQNHRHATGFEMNELEWLSVQSETGDYGTRMQIEPVIGPDSRTIDLNIQLSHHYARPTERWEPAAQTGQRRIESRVTDYHKANFATATTMITGTTKLLNVWRVEGAPEPERANAMQAAFLTGDIVSVLPLSNIRVESLLKSNGEKVVPTPLPGTKPPDNGLPPGMILRRFRVPPDFLSMGSAGVGAAASPDPFSSRTAPKNEARVMKAVTAMDVLKMEGIPFPDGASANFSPISGELIVRNTPENTEKVASFLDGLLKKTPLVVGITGYVVQADGALLRRISAETSTVAEHSAAWSLIEDAVAQGKAKILRATWIETRSGQRMTMESGTQYMHVGDSSISGDSTSVSTTDTQAKGNEKPTSDKEQKAAPPVMTVVDRSHPLLSAEHETTHVGLKFELEPVVGPDGHTVDLDFSLDYDYARPTQRFEPAGGADKVLRAESPGTDFHKAEVATAITLNSGSTRLIGTWKPEGTPEFQSADILQAAFVRVDLIKVEQQEKAAAKKP